MEIFSQNEFILNGNGKIIYDHYEVDTLFQVEYNSLRIILKTSKIIMGQLFSINTGRFEGFIEESNLKIECSKICLTQYTKYQLTFVLLEDLIIGNNLNFKIFKAKLFGLNKKINEFKVEDYLIHSNKLKNFENLNTHINKFGCNLETSEITIRKSNSKSLDKINTIETCKNICLLISFITARNIIFNRCEFIDENQDNQKVIKIKLNNYSYGKKFIYEDDLSSILPTFYGNFKNMNSIEQKCLFTSINYLNSTSSQFLEDTILNVSQIWEILSDTFVNEKITNTENINTLRSELKSNIKQWHKKNEIKDYDLGFIMNRVLGALDWEKVIIKIETLVNNENLDSEKIGLDFKKLIILRNQIAHSGRFNQTGNEDEYLVIYNSALLGIKVLLLNRLGYSGKITYFIGGIARTKNISYYLK